MPEALRVKNQLILCHSGRVTSSQSHKQTSSLVVLPNSAWKYPNPFFVVIHSVRRQPVSIFRDDCEHEAVQSPGDDPGRQRRDLGHLHQVGVHDDDPVHVSSLLVRVHQSCGGKFEKRNISFCKIKFIKLPREIQSYSWKKKRVCSYSVGFIWTVLILFVVFASNERIKFWGKQSIKRTYGGWVEYFNNK